MNNPRAIISAIVYHNIVAKLAAVSLYYIERFRSKNLSTYLFRFNIDIFVHSLLFYSYVLDVEFAENYGKIIGYLLTPPYRTLLLDASITYKV